MQEKNRRRLLKESTRDLSASVKDTHQEPPGAAAEQVRCLLCEEFFDPDEDYEHEECYRCKRVMCSRCMDNYPVYGGPMVLPNINQLMVCSACIEDLVGPALGYEKSTVGHHVVWTKKE